MDKVPLISNTPDKKYKPRVPGNGWYLMTHSETKEKKRYIKEIAEKLGIRLKVEII